MVIFFGLMNPVRINYLTELTAAISKIATFNTIPFFRLCVITTAFVFRLWNVELSIAAGLMEHRSIPDR